MNNDDRQWAEALLERALKRLRKEYEAAGKLEQFDLLKPYLHAIEAAAPSYAQAADTLGQTEAAVRQLVHRLRRRLRALLRTEIDHTVCDPAEIEDELRYLIKLLRP